MYKLPPRAGAFPQKYRLFKLYDNSRDDCSIKVTLSGIVRLARLAQFLNAYHPMLVTVFGMTTLLKPVQSKKVWGSILVIP